MKKILTYSAVLLPLLLGSCGYTLGGFVRADMKDMKTFSVNMFANKTLYPNVAMQMTTAVGVAMQKDGTFEMASSGSADFSVSGAVTGVEYERLLVDWRDSYQSLEVGVKVSVSYTITDNRNGKVVTSGELEGEGSYFNTRGNPQVGRDAALSYATRRAAAQLVDRLTAP